MKRLLALAGLGVALSGCIVIVDPPSGPAISNLRSQVFYCTGAAGTTTNYKFKFDVNRTISGIEVYLTNWAGDTPPSTPNQVGGPVQGPTTETVTINGTQRVARAVLITAGAGDAPQLGNFVGVVSAPTLKPQAIGVTQGTLWVRAKLPNGSFSDYLASKDGMTSSADSATCNTPIGNVP
jgi:hypothetical protein